MRKTVVSIALVLTMLATCCQPVMSQEARQTSWNLGDVFSSSKEAEKEITKIQDEITQMASYRGKLAYSARKRRKSTIAVI